MELRHPFGIRELLDGRTARSIFDRCNERLATPEFHAQGLLSQFKVAVVCTTDDPADSLEHHDALARRVDPDTRVYPTWRPDRALAIQDPARWNVWIAELERASGLAISGWSSFWEALEARHAAFHERGCRASDHGLEQVFAEECGEAEAAAGFDRLRRGQALEAGEAHRLKSALLHRMAVMDHARGWVQQFHLGALRNTNTRLRRELGADSGLDSIGDFETARPLARFLDRLDAQGALARTVLYNSNPRDNELFATMIGNFQDGSVPGKMQYGGAWWFLDQKEGMEAQMSALSNMGLFARFVGMVTDSRSFLSYSRHEYFRRLVCNLLGNDVRAGLVPDDRALLARLARNVCYFNARAYLGLEVGRLGRGVEPAAA
jgi:glucuronate isomerase